MGRHYGDIERIDPKKVKDFFNRRTADEKNPLNAVMLQNAASNLPAQKDEYEKTHLLPSWPSPARIFEIGCGAGRLAAHYLAAGHSYVGIDFSESMVDLARKTYAGQKAYFEVAAVPDVDPTKLPLTPPYQLILVSALCLYLNDSDVTAMLKLIGKCADKPAVVYIRESLSELDRRLTLRDFYSEELKADYNAIYRTVPEFTKLCEDGLGPSGFKLEKTDYAFPPEMRQRSETVQYYYLFRR